MKVYSNKVTIINGVNVKLKNKLSVLIALTILSFNVGANQVSKQIIIFNAGIYNDTPKFNIEVSGKGMRRFTLSPGRLQDVIYSNTAPMVATYHCKLYEYNRVTYCGEDPDLISFRQLGINTYCKAISHEMARTVLYCGDRESVESAARTYPSLSALEQVMN